jgi:hypothetical protein
MPTENHPTPITLSARRSQAAAIAVEASGLGTSPPACWSTSSTFVTAGALGSVGLSHVEIRRVAAALWATDDSRLLTESTADPRQLFR